MERAKSFFVLARIALGIEFLWAFFDKLLGLGFATKFADAWVRGGSPTTGFLKFGVHGPFANFFHSLSGQVWVDWLFMAGLLGIGIALTFGIFAKAGAWCGALMLTLMWLALFPPENNPIFDEHLIYTLFLVGVALDSSIAKKKWPSFS